MNFDEVKSDENDIVPYDHTYVHYYHTIVPNYFLTCSCVINYFFPHQNASETTS